MTGRTAAGTVSILAAWLLTSGGTASATPRTWDNGGGNNDWFTATNWNPDGSPAQEDDLTISSGTPVAGANVNVNNGSVTIDGGDVTWAGRFHTIGNIDSGSLLISSGSLTVNYSGGSSHSFNVGNVGSGIFQQTGGAVTAANDNDEVFIGNQAGSTGSYQISGGTLTAGRVLNGNAGTGTLTIVGDAAAITLTSATSYSQAGSSTLQLDIGSGISAIDAAGNVALGGTLAVGFSVTPTVGQQFAIVNYGGVLSGTFATFDTLVDSPAGSGTVTLSIAYGDGSDDSVTLTVESVTGVSTCAQIEATVLNALCADLTANLPTLLAELVTAVDSAFVAAIADLGEPTDTTVAACLALIVGNLGL